MLIGVKSLNPIVECFQATLRDCKSEDQNRLLFFMIFSIFFKYLDREKIANLKFSTLYCSFSGYSQGLQSGIQL